MSSILTDEGLDALIAVLPKNGSNYATLYVGLFTSQTSSTVPSRSATGGASPSGWTEQSGSGYARQSIAAAGWGADSTSGTGRKTTASSAVTFTASAAWASANNGFFIATQSASGSGDKILYFANFDSGAARTLSASGDTLSVTPAFTLTQG